MCFVYVYVVVVGFVLVDFVYGCMFGGKLVEKDLVEMIDNMCKICGGKGSCIDLC